MNITPKSKNNMAKKKSQPEYENLFTEQGALRVHSREQYGAVGSDLFINHLRQYVRGDAPVPMMNVRDSRTNEDVGVTFSDELLQEFSRDERQIKKPLEVMMKYGFGHYCSGGRNGIFYVRDNEEQLESAAQKGLRKHEDTIRSELGSPPNDPLKSVKAVWHNDGNYRIVGFHSGKQKSIHLIGYAQKDS
jgi:hypothetical protein